MSEERTRLAKRDDVNYQFGLLVRPLQDLFSFEIPPDLATIARIQQSFLEDMSNFLLALKNYCKHDGLFYRNAYLRIEADLREFVTILAHKEFLSQKSIFKLTETSIREEIGSIPCDLPPDVIRAESPFSAYLKIRTLFASAQTSVNLFEPWLKTSHFYRYLYEVPEQCTVKVVTDYKIKTDEKRYKQVEAVAKLFKEERRDKFHLSLYNVHDRHLRIDGNQNLLFGNSLDRAGLRTFFSYSPANDTNTIRELDQALANSQKWF